MIIAICILGILLILCLRQPKYKFEDVPDSYSLKNLTCVPFDEFEMDREKVKIRKYFFLCEEAFACVVNYGFGSRIKFQDMEFEVLKSITSPSYLIRGFYYADIFCKVDESKFPK